MRSLSKPGGNILRLNHQGNDQQLYRFSCKIAMAGHAQFILEEATTQPLQAMQQVLQQVEHRATGCGGG